MGVLALIVRQSFQHRGVARHWQIDQRYWSYGYNAGAAKLGRMTFVLPYTLAFLFAPWIHLALKQTPSDSQNA